MSNKKEKKLEKKISSNIKKIIGTLNLYTIDKGNIIIKDQLRECINKATI